MSYRKGANAERRCQRILEAAGYWTCRAAGSHGEADVIALSPQGVRLIQVKCGNASAGPLEREAIEQIPRPTNASVEIWCFKPHAREPKITVL